MFGICKEQCGRFRTADPLADWVKIGLALIAEGKENFPPGNCKENSSQLVAEECKLEEAWQSAEAERKCIEAAKVEQRRAAAEAAAGNCKENSSQLLAEERKLEEEQQSAEAERKRIEAAEVKQRRAAAEAAAKAESEHLKKEQLRALEVAEDLRHWEQQSRLEEQHRLEAAIVYQQERDAAERAELAKDEAARIKVQKFLKDNGFNSDNSKKTSLMSHKYALHAAVDKKDAKTVAALLRCKADPSLQNSSKKTPQQLASSSNKKGSHDQVLMVLRAHAQ